MDKILIRDLKLFGYHGVNPEEKRDGQHFYLDIDAFLDLSRPCETDVLNDTVSYSKIVKCASAAFGAEKNDLIERAAQRVAEAVLAAFPPVRAVEVTLKKPEAPIRAEFGYVAVSIVRERHA